MNKTPQNLHLSRTVHSVVHSELRPFWKEIVHSEVWARVPFKFVRRTKDVLNGFCLVSQPDSLLVTMVWYSHMCIRQVPDIMKLKTLKNIE